MITRVRLDVFLALTLGGFAEPAPDHRLETIRRMRAARRPLREIAAVAGVSPMTVWRKLRAVNERGTRAA